MIQKAYNRLSFIEENVGNKLLAPNWSGKLFVPACSDVPGEWHDDRSEVLALLTQTSNTSFASEDDGQLTLASGLSHFVRTRIWGTPTAIFDNHNHALTFWYEAYFGWIIQEWVTLFHVDEHSDLWANSFDLSSEDLRDISSVEQFVREKTNVGNYIQPAIRSALIARVHRIEWEQELLTMRNVYVPENSILNLDLDIFSPDLDDVSESLKYEVIRYLAARVRYITIATSPFFIEHDRAIHHLLKIFE